MVSSFYYRRPTPDTFEYGFETGGSSAMRQSASGETRTVGDPDSDPVVVMRGSYEYVGDDGRTYAVTWYADETGFHPEGRHIPTSEHGRRPSAVETHPR